MGEACADLGVRGEEENDVGPGGRGDAGGVFGMLVRAVGVGAENALFAGLGEWS